MAKKLRNRIAVRATDLISKKKLDKSEISFDLLGMALHAILKCRGVAGASYEPLQTVQSGTGAKWQ